MLIRVVSGKAIVLCYISIGVLFHLIFPLSSMILLLVCDSISISIVLCYIHIGVLFHLLFPLSFVILLFVRVGVLFHLLFPLSFVIFLFVSPTYYYYYKFFIIHTLISIISIIIIVIHYYINFFLIIIIINFIISFIIIIIITVIIIITSCYYYYYYIIFYIFVFYHSALLPSPVEQATSRAANSLSRASSSRISCPDQTIEDGEVTSSSSATRQCSRVQSRGVARWRCWALAPMRGVAAQPNMAYGRGVGPRGWLWQRQWVHDQATDR